MSIPYYDCIAHHAMRRPESLAAVDLATGRHHTYHSFNERIARLAGSLRRNYEIAAGERVAVLAPNTTDTFEVQFACGRLGAIFVPLNWRLANPELRAILADCTPAMLIYDPEFAARAEQLAQARGIGRMVSLGLAFERIALDGPQLDQPAAVSFDDISTILYTSGTTGLPKGAIISHGMNFWNTVHCMASIGIQRSTVFLGMLPLFHSGGLNVFSYPTFQAGGTVIITRAFDAGEALRLIGDPAIGVTHIFGVPANFQFMAQHPKLRGNQCQQPDLRRRRGRPDPGHHPRNLATARGGAAASLRHDRDQSPGADPGQGRRGSKSRFRRQARAEHGNARGHRRRHRRSVRHDRRSVGQRPEHHQRLLAATRGHRRVVHRWLAAYRRRRADR